MKNPLYKRLSRELAKDLGKYLVIFLFMAATIGFVSGFLVADNSMIAAYNESFEKYKIEDGNFTSQGEVGDKDLERLSKKGVEIYKNYFVEESADVNRDGVSEGTLRIFQQREQVNLACLMEGEFPGTKEEIAVDRMYADNNEIQVGDSIFVGTKKLLVCGLVALSDYSCLFSDNSDMMFDSIKFGVGVMSEEGFQSFGARHLTYRYSWIYNQPPGDEDREREMADDFLEELAKRITLTDFIPRYANQAIQFTGDDMGGDKSMMTVLLYILIVIMAFVFAVTTNNTISREAPVIGTLRAMGYRKGELLGHYICLPLLVTLLAALAGNILGYTVFKNLCAAMYYGSYSLPTYVTRWNGEAFLLTTAVPFGIMLAIQIALISWKLQLAPLKFLRRDLNRFKNKKAVRLPNFRFFNRFRLRIILQNLSGYATLLVGAVFANVLLLFGMMMSPLLEHYQEETVDHMMARYQYILNVPEETEEEEDPYTLWSVVQKLISPSLETDNSTAEKFCVETLKNRPENREGENITVYGISQESRYLASSFPEDGVAISDGYAQKYKVSVGDKILLEEVYGDGRYQFTVKDVYYYPAALGVFMSAGQFRRVFDKPEDYFNGYFADSEITDLEEGNIASTITEDDLTKVSRQLDVSMGQMFIMINVFAVALFLLLIYLLTKLIIEKNAASISMVKILGYETGEIMGLYLISTSWVVVFSLLLSLWIATWLLRLMYVFIMAEFSGWLTFYVKPAIYPEMFVMGILSYLFVAALQFGKIKRIPMDEALKNVE